MRRIITLLTVVVIGAASLCFFDRVPIATVPLPTAADAVETAETAELSEPAKLGLFFSAESGFYSDTVSVELVCSDKEADIYFTKDGSKPGVDSEKYSEPIMIRAKSAVTVTTIKAAAVKDGEISEICTKSYITGTDVFNRFAPSVLVFVLSADPHDLYDYYDGVANEGFLRDEYEKEHGPAYDPTAPANYNKRGVESERVFYVETFDSDGNLLISQGAGGRVVGGWSREPAQKSWQLYARKDYGGGKFKYAFFGRELSESGGIIAEYDKIRLRNNANDREFAAVRDELTQKLAREAGFPDTQLARPAAVFLNGEYYGFSWLKESYGDGYLSAKYGGLKENYQIISNDESGNDGVDFAVKDYAYVYDLAKNGLTGDEKFNEFCNLVDIDNLMMYYAVEIYIDNKDWPNNNMSMWRYYPGEGEEITNQFNDGKWRFLMYDVEYAWSLYGNNNKFYKDDTLKNVLSGNHMGGKSEILNALLKRPDMREKFANVMCDLIGGAFSPDNVISALDELVDMSENELTYALENPGVINGKKVNYSDWADKYTFSDNREQIRDFAKNRPEIIYKSIENNFSCSGMYTIALTGAGGAAAFMNTRKIDGYKTAAGRYFSDFAVEINAEIYPGYMFDYWEINGEKNYDETVKIAPVSDGGIVDIKLFVTEMTEDEEVFIKSADYGKDGWIELYNPGSAAVSAKRFYLSDDPDNLMKWKIPAIKIMPESSLIIVLKSNNSEDALMKARTNFNLKKDESIYLSDIDGNIISVYGANNFP